MDVLRAVDWRAGFELIGRLVEVSETGESDAALATAAAQAVSAHVASDITTSSVCHLKSGHRQVIGSPAIGAAERAAFDHHFHEHPLLRYHADRCGGGAHRVSDLWSMTQFRRTALYADYYHRIGIDQVVALPLHVDDDTLVSLVLNRSGHDFSDRECLWLDLVGAPSARLYQRGVRARRQPDPPRSEPGIVAPTGARGGPTPREHEVLRWLAAGKTDRDIGMLLQCSHRTVQKHLQRIYVKLGVETRTAAVMRVMAVDRG